MTFDVVQFADKSAKAAVPFPSSSWDYVLELLALVIVADKKIFKVEVDTFLEAAIELRAIIDPKICLTEKMAHDWFKRNKPKLEKIIDNRSHDTALREIIEPIKFMPHKLDVISCMVRIAVSDGEYCDVEKELIKKTCLYWDVRSNLQPNLEYLHSPDDSPQLIDSLKGHPWYARVEKNRSMKS